ncbi:MAG: NUDIX hydrolase, partial [Planctomycetota bacterium]
TGAVVIIATTDDDRIVLVEQFRTPLGKSVIELPAGLVGDEAGQDDALTAARRELLEETGYRAESVEIVMEGPTSAGLSDEVVTLVRARGLTKAADGGGVGHEEITAHTIPLPQAEPWLFARMREGVAVDPKVFAGLYFAADDRR